MDGVKHLAMMMMTMTMVKVMMMMILISVDAVKYLADCLFDSLGNHLLHFNCNAHLVDIKEDDDEGSTSE